MDIPALLAFADRLADAARAETLPRFRAGAAVENKAGERGFDPVTAADRGAEAAIRALIEAAYPDHGVEGEEFGPKAAAGPFSWTLDPIDGTRAYIAGLPTWGTLIALSHEGRPVLGIVDLPYVDERYRGWPGGADVADRAGRRPLQTRPCAGLPDAIVSTTDPELFDPAEAAAFTMVRRGARGARLGLDCSGYAAVAAGGLDLVIESGLKPYDIRAILPVVAGAGGIVTDWRGRENPDGGQVVAAGDRRTLEAALVALHRSATVG